MSETPVNKSNSKVLLAKLLATENIRVVRDPNASTASFNVKDRILTMPIWKGVSEDLEDMLTVHETGHALDTPSEGWLDAIENIAKKIYGGKPSMRQKTAVQGFLNVIEDARIDKRQKRRYPGSRRNYLVGYRELIDRGFFGPKDRDVNSYNFIDRANMYFKGGFASGIKFSPEEMPFVRRMESTETFEEVVALAEEVFAFSKDKLEEEQAELPQDLDWSDAEDFDSEDFDDSEWLDSDDMRDDGAEDERQKRAGSFDDNDPDAEEDGSEDEASAESGDGEPDQNDQGQGDLGAVSKSKGKGGDDPDKQEKGADKEKKEAIPESSTEQTWSEKIQELTDPTIAYDYVSVPKPDLKQIVDDYKVFLSSAEAVVARNNYYFTPTKLEGFRRGFSDFKNSENQTISYMVKEFETRKAADLYSRVSTAKTGVIDTNKLHSYKYNDDIFRRLSVVPQGKNHGFIMFLDWSGSMHDNIMGTVKQLMSLTLFCKRVQIPFEVYLFRSVNASDKAQYNPFAYNDGSVMFHPFKLRNILSSRMSLSELNRAYLLLWIAAAGALTSDSMGNTPLNPAIVVAEELIKQFRARNKLQIVNTIFLTDGDSDGPAGISGRGLYYNPARVPDGSKIKTRKYILVDEDTKREYPVLNSFYSKGLTQALLQRLKDRTDCNLIGFYLYSPWSRGYGGRDKAAYAEFFGAKENEKHYNEMISMWNTNKFMPVTSRGYDTYYVIDARAMKDISGQTLDVDSKMTAARVARAFLSYASKKTVNRILLQRFISEIASQKKIA